MSDWRDSTSASTVVRLAELQGELPQVPRRVALARGVLSSPEIATSFRRALAWLTDHLGTSLRIDACEAIEGLAGQSSADVVAYLAQPRGTRSVGLGLESGFAHMMIDRLLGSPACPGRDRMALSPVEWGVLNFVLGRSLLLFNEPADEVIWLLERVGSDPFAPSDPSSYLTLRWPVQLAGQVSSLWMWIPDSILGEPRDFLPIGLIQGANGSQAHTPGWIGALSSHWAAVIGEITLQRGPGSLRAGGVLPLSGMSLSGTPSSPTGLVDLELRTRTARTWYAARCVPLSGGGRLYLESPRNSEAMPREDFAMSHAPDRRVDQAEPSEGPETNQPAPGTADRSVPDPAPPTSIPVTLTVELGRVQLSVARIATLGPGDIIELNRHAREPVELTSGGKLVARGELVMIDTELGVRVTSVFL